MHKLAKLYKKILTQLTRLWIFVSSYDTNIFILTAFLWIILINSYVCDDAFITFRTVDNFVRGYGLTWNTIERVQTYTNPLWMFVHSLFYFFIKSDNNPTDPTRLYMLTMLLSVVFSLLALILILKPFKKYEKYDYIIILTIISSKAFIDFTTSGLENPLSYLLLVVFFIKYLQLGETYSLRNLQEFALITSLAYLNRIDLVLLLVFPLIHVAYKTYKSYKFKIIKSLFIGFLPILVWQIFALIYYGMLFPNTYYAKMELGVSQFIMISKGVVFSLSIFKTDPLTMGIIAIAIFSAFKLRDKNFYVGVSLVFYWLYVLNTGGDFMGGRFFSAPFLVSLILLLFVYRDSYKKYYLELILFFILYNLSLKSVPLKALSRPEGNTDKNYYFDASNVFNLPARLEFPFSPFHVMLDQTYCDNLRKNAPIVAINAGGINGFCRGPGKYLIDPQSVTDVLMARLPLPNIVNTNFMPGHISKAIPKGYEDSFINNKNMIQDAGLKEYYEKILVVTRGHLFNIKRLQYIWELNTSQRKYYIYSDEWRCVDGCQT